jgi:hypothetical protein
MCWAGSIPDRRRHPPPFELWPDTPEFMVNLWQSFLWSSRIAELGSTSI